MDPIDWLLQNAPNLPYDWAQSQNNLAEIYTYFQDWRNVAACYANVLKMRPNDQKAYQMASSLYHDAFNDFALAFALNQNWLQTHPEDLSAQCDFAEKHFTTGRFAECEMHLAALLAKLEVEPRVKIALGAIQITNMAALNQTRQIPNKLEALQTSIASQPDTFKVRWTFNGTQYFIDKNISENANLGRYREWLLQLFQALEIEEGRDAIRAALQRVQVNLKAVPNRKD